MLQPDENSHIDPHFPTDDSADLLTIPDEVVQHPVIKWGCGGCGIFVFLIMIASILVTYKGCKLATSELDYHTRVVNLLTEEAEKLTEVIELGKPAYLYFDMSKRYQNKISLKEFEKRISPIFNDLHGKFATAYYDHEFGGQPVESRINLIFDTDIEDDGVSLPRDGKVTRVIFRFSCMISKSSDQEESPLEPADEYTLRCPLSLEEAKVETLPIEELPDVAAALNFLHQLQNHDAPDAHHLFHNDALVDSETFDGDEVGFEDFAQKVRDRIKGNNLVVGSRRYTPREDLASDVAVTFVDAESKKSVVKLKMKLRYTSGEPKYRVAQSFVKPIGL